jgi:tRNA(Ile)-lysidine synthase TilS/MesJ
MLAKITRLFNKACQDFKLISPGDRIMVGLSGGKDSLTMCHVLCLLRDSHSIPFEVLCTYIQFSNIPYRCDLGYLRQFCDEHRVQLKMVEDEIREAHMGGVLRFACVHCARFRRAKLLEQTRLEHCNKLALGHHLDDIAATLLMNMSQHGKFAGMAVKLDITAGEQNYPMTIIRPLCYIGEDDIRAFALGERYKQEKCKCDWGDAGVRPKARETLDILARFDENARMNLFRSQFNIGQQHVDEPSSSYDIEEGEEHICRGDI